MWEVSLFSRPFLAFALCRLFDDGYFDRWEVILQCRCVDLICFFYIYLFVCFWVYFFVCASSVLLCAGFLSLRCVGFSLRWLLLLGSTGSRRSGFSSWTSHELQLQCTGLVAPWQVGSSQTMNRTCTRHTLNLWTTRKVLNLLFSNNRLQGRSL